MPEWDKKQERGPAGGGQMLPPGGIELDDFVDGGRGGMALGQREAEGAGAGADGFQIKHGASRRELLSQLGY